MLNIGSIEKIVGVSSPISPIMANALESWIDEFTAKTGADDKSGIRPLNMAYFASGYIAKLMNLEIEMTLDGGERSKLIVTAFERFRNDLLTNAAQVAVAMSHCVIKPYISRGKLSIELIGADKFIPVEFEGNRLTSAVFIDEIVNGTIYFRRLEWHRFEKDVYIVENKAFRSASNKDLGDEVTLSSVEQWSNLQPHISIKNIDRPLFGYFRMPFTNNIDISSPLPISIYANAMITLREIERQYDNYCHEFRSGRRKRYIDRSALVKDKNGEYIENADDYIMVTAANQSQEGLFKDYTPTIRETDMRMGLETQLRILESQLHISQGTFSINPVSGAVTATQIISIDRTTFHTIQSLQKAEEQALRDMVYAMGVYCTLYSLAPVENIEPAFSFGDSVFEDTATVLQQLVTLKSSGAISAAELRAWWTGETVEQAEKSLPKQEFDTFEDTQE